jgi:hypothetical protein
MTWNDLMDRLFGPDWPSIWLIVAAVVAMW